ncbi:hypothetical protein RRG08_008141 [Elysia crispata]|uniref:Uncharacterized protein n=1 Tax=Elysia crispata TaxID=231223 RepID=A0AAE0Z536_9GAST|nr:hypothetical protein RRG08_008141 [Elysia crispata]
MLPALLRHSTVAVPTSILAWRLLGRNTRDELDDYVGEPFLTKGFCERYNLTSWPETGKRHARHSSQRRRRGERGYTT